MNTQLKQKTEIQRSTEFWQNNKQLEQEIDNLLKQLKYFDQEVNCSQPRQPHCGTLCPRSFGVKEEAWASAPPATQAHSFAIPGRNCAL